MDFFREKKQAETALASFAENEHMYLWNIDDAYHAAILIFGVDSTGAL
jgi:hypothetical protein